MWAPRCIVKVLSEIFGLLNSDLWISFPRHVQSCSLIQFQPQTTYAPAPVLTVRVINSLLGKPPSHKHSGDLGPQQSYSLNYKEVICWAEWPHHVIEIRSFRACDNHGIWNIAGNTRRNGMAFEREFQEWSWH